MPAQIAPGLPVCAEPSAVGYRRTVRFRGLVAQRLAATVPEMSLDMKPAQGYRRNGLAALDSP